MQTSLPHDESKEDQSIDELAGNEDMASGFTMTSMLLQEDIERGERYYLYDILNII